MPHRTSETFSRRIRAVDLVRPQQRPVDDRHDTGGGAVDGPEGVELLEEARRETRRLGERARGGGIQALGDVEPSAGKRPQALVRVPRAPHERDDDRRAVRPRLAPQREDHRRDGDARRILRRVAAREARSGLKAVCVMVTLTLGIDLIVTSTRRQTRSRDEQIHRRSA